MQCRVGRDRLTTEQIQMRWETHGERASGKKRKDLNRRISWDLRRLGGGGVK